MIVFAMMLSGSQPSFALYSNSLEELGLQTNGAATSTTAPPFLLPADGHPVMVAPFGVAAILLSAPTIAAITIAI